MIFEGNRKDFIGVLQTIVTGCDKWQEKFHIYSTNLASTNFSLNFAMVAKEIKEEILNIDEPFRLGVIGMFKSGKSSVLNTFLNRRVLKEGRTETTSVLTELAFAESIDLEKGEILFLNDVKKEVTISEALEYTDIRSAVFKNLSSQEKHKKQESIKKIVLYLHCELLRNVRLLDTPGFGGSKIGDDKAFESLLDVDAALMIFSADRVGAKNELEIADELNRRGRDIVALLNKVDDGKGTMRREEELENSETFIREHFRKVVADSSGKRIIFRYSATEVWKILELTKLGKLTKEQQEEAIKAMSCWGYIQTEDSDMKKGVLAFIRENYNTASNNRKLGNAKIRLLRSIETLIKSTENELLRIEQVMSEAKIQQSQREDRLEKEINPKIDQINIRIKDIVFETTGPFIRDIESSLIATIDKFTAVDMEAFFRIFKTDEELQNEIEQEFRISFPKWREQDLMEDIERQVHNLLRREWMFLFNEIRKIDPSIELPEYKKLLEDIHSTVQRFAAVLGTNIAAWATFILIPGGAVIAIIAIVITELLGGYYATKHARKIQESKNKLELQMRNFAMKLKHEILTGAQSANNELADKARKSAQGELDEIAKKISEQKDFVDKLKKAIEDVKLYKNMLNQLEI